MKSNIILILALLLLSCGHDNNKITEKKEQENNKQIEMDNENIEIESISPKLLEIIDDMISFYDNYYKESTIKPNIFIITFYKTDNECYIEIVQHLYLFCIINDLKGYEIIKNRLIAFYNTESECNCGLVNPCKLKKDTINDTFLNEKAEINIFETSGRIYKIHSKDSLELTFTGFI
jgi:hypothetical protein